MDSAHQKWSKKILQSQALFQNELDKLYTISCSTFSSDSLVRNRAICFRYFNGTGTPKQTQRNPYSKALRLKRSSPRLWNVLEKFLDPKKKSPPDGPLLELKKSGEPCKCFELFIAWESQDIHYVMSHFFKIKITLFRQLKIVRRLLM